MLTAVFCLNAATGYAQTKKETPREKVSCLERKNAQLNNQIKKAITLKPYYKTMEIQNLCEKYPAAKREIEDMYKFQYLKFQLTEAWITQEKPINLPFLKHSYKTITVFHGRARAYNRGTILIRFPVAYDGKPIK